MTAAIIILIPTQSSLPERQNPPGLEFDNVPLCAPSENNMVTITIGIDILAVVIVEVVMTDGDKDIQVREVADRQRRLKPITPTKPSTLSFRFSKSSLLSIFCC